MTTGYNSCYAICYTSLFSGDKRYLVSPLQSAQYSTIYSPLQRTASSTECNTENICSCTLISAFWVRELHEWLFFCLFCFVFCLFAFYRTVWVATCWMVDAVNMQGPYHGCTQSSYNYALVFLLVSVSCDMYSRSPSRCLFWCVNKLLIILGRLKGHGPEHVYNTLCYICMVRM